MRRLRSSAPTAPFAEKLAYYKTQDTSRGVRSTHLVGIPTVVSSLPPDAAPAPP